MPDERFLILQMHELLSYLAQQGVLTILVLAQHGLVGTVQSPLDISYLSDAVLMLRYFGLAPLKWRGICSAGGPSFELGGAEVVERGVSADRIVEAVDVTGNGLFSLSTSVENGAPNHLGFQRLEERLHHRVIVAVALSRHRYLDAMAA